MQLGPLRAPSTAQCATALLQRSLVQRGMLTAPWLPVTGVRACGLAAERHSGAAPSALRISAAAGPQRHGLAAAAALHCTSLPVASHLRRCIAAAAGATFEGPAVGQLSATQLQTVIAEGELPCGLQLHDVWAAVMQSGVGQMTVHELGDLLADDVLRETVQLIDVREDWEAEEASIPGFLLLPLSRLQEWTQDLGEQLDPEAHTIVLCHHGVRSNMVAHHLISERVGFRHVSNVAGGIDAWSSIDPKTPRY